MSQKIKIKAELEIEAEVLSDPDKYVVDAGKIALELHVCPTGGFLADAEEFEVWATTCSQKILSVEWVDKC